MSIYLGDIDLTFGLQGADGISPVITTTTTSNGYNLTITDVDGTKTINIKHGTNGTNGKDGTNGTNGKSAYQYAKDAGYTGTESAFATKLAAAIPTKTSDITNDSEFITKNVGNLSNYYKKSETYTRSETYSKAEVDNTIAESIMGVHQHRVITVTLNKADWNADKRQSVSIPISVSHNTDLIRVYAETDRANIENISNSRALCIEADDNIMTFEVKRVPNADLKFVVEVSPIGSVGNYFTLIDVYTSNAIQCEFENGMTLTDWVYSDLNTCGIRCNGASGYEGAMSLPCIFVTNNGFTIYYDEELTYDIVSTSAKILSIGDCYYYTSNEDGAPV